VREAEQVVCDAWIQALAAHRDQAHATMLTAAARCDDARRSLARALAERAPNPIATAQAAMEEALAAGRQAARSYEQAQGGLARELDLLLWRNSERRMEACIARNGEPTPQTAQIEQAEQAERTEQAEHAGQSERTERPQPDREQSVPVLSRLSRRLLPWCLCLAVSFTPGRA